MEMDALKSKDHFKNYRLLVTNPVKLMSEIKHASSFHSFFILFVSIGLIMTVFMTLMPYELFEKVFMKEAYGVQFIEGVNSISVKDTMDMFNEPYFRLSFYLVSFFWGDGLILLSSITFYWLVLWAFTRTRKYPAEFGEVANIYMISYTPVLLYMLGATIFQYATQTVTLIPYDSLGYTVWKLANPFVLIQTVLMGIGIHKTLDMSKLIAAGIVLVYFGLWVLLSL